MRLFQNSGLYPRYRRLFNKRNDPKSGFDDRIDSFLRDRYNASHILLPVLNRAEHTFLTNGDDSISQFAWARENSLLKDTSLEDILLAQIEHHRTEVFYNLDPVRYDSRFLKRLPGCVKKSICWRAAPSNGADFSSYDNILCNFPSIIALWRGLGWKSTFFSPAHDPVMDVYAARTDRPIDLLFVGGFGRHHTRRAAVLESISELASRYNVAYFIDKSIVNLIVEFSLSFLPRSSTYCGSKELRSISRPAVFGLDLYEQLSRAKVVLNGAIDMAGKDRGNMRCFELLGCGALMLSDVGDYPKAFVDGNNMVLYQDAAEAPKKAVEILQNWGNYNELARNGHDMVKAQYSKIDQWLRFESLL